MTNVETARLEEARRALWLRLLPGCDMTLINDLEAAVRAAVQDQPVSDAEVEAAAKALYEYPNAPDEKAAWLEGPWDATDDGLKGIYREYARAALAAAREARNA